MTPEDKPAPGSKQWMKELATEIATAAHDRLEAIVVDASRRHSGSKMAMTDADKTKMALIICEVQDQSFLLGLQMAAEVMGKKVEEV